MEVGHAGNFWIEAGLVNDAAKLIDQQGGKVFPDASGLPNHPIANYLARLGEGSINV
ncbi:MAG: hypothetical protein O7E53_01400 [Alphaproteobacteria bacterium]|nr:hypothetical protein [Alphaproteobacteria bacterium]